jgi:hypothetical protein
MKFRPPDQGKEAETCFRARRSHCRQVRHRVNGAAATCVRIPSDELSPSPTVGYKQLLPDTTVREIPLRGFSSCSSENELWMVRLILPPD